MTSARRLILVPALLLGVAAATAQQPAARPKASPIPEDCKILRDQAYGTHERNKLDLYIPKTDAALPLVIWIHGGGWEAGSKAGWNPAWDLLRRGYALASINYRLSSQALFPAQIEDCQAAVRWLRSNAKENHLDPDHFGAWGLSAGGHLVALLGTIDDKAFPAPEGAKQCSCGVQCVCDWFGPTDFLNWGTVTADNPLANRPSAVSRLFGGTVSEKKELARQASPVTYVSKKSVPFLIYHGDKDPVVPLQQSEELNDALKKAGVDSTLHVIKDNGHGGPGFTAPDVIREEEQFFDRYLKAKTINQ